MKNPLLPLIISTAILVSPALGAEQPPADQFETWLIPVSELARPGAYGAIWGTTAWIGVDGDPADLSDSVAMGPFGRCETLCTTLLDIPPMPPFAATLVTSGTNDPPGQLFFVERQEANRVWMKVRVQDLARTTPMRVGVEIPIVRESDLFTGGHILLLNVPGDPQFRQWLRIYDVDRKTGSQFRIVGRRQESGDPVFEATLQAIVPASVFAPGAASLDLRALIPQEPEATFYLEVTPLDPSIRYWAFATVTSNETQEIVTVTP
ncbi:MAG: hypothetical protein ACYC7A_05060 [Thermoanaerobaculia bacterium]